MSLNPSTPAALPRVSSTAVDPIPVARNRSEADQQARVFFQLRKAQLRNGLKVALESGRVKLLTMLGTSAFVTLVVFGLSLYAINQLFENKVPAKGLIVGGLFDLMFFTLGGMLVFSTGIILYASLFTSPESRFLLTTPARADRVFATKFQSAVMFSSWAFMILGLPILIAYGMTVNVPWYYYLFLPIYLLGFVLLPSSISAIICLCLVRFMPRNRKQALIWMILFGVVIGGFWGYRVARNAGQSLVTQKKNDVEGLIGQFALVQHPLIPSHWMTNGIMAAARDEKVDAFRPLMVIWSNGLFAYLFAAWVSSRLYRTGYDRIAGAGRAKKVYRSSFLDAIMNLLVFYLDKPTRILIVKDFRTFRRDPTQWVLLFIFGGLMLLAAMNLRQYYKNDLPVMDKYAVSIINFAGMAVLLCAGLSRFIFPLMSLEGRKFWILGLLPLKREQILFGKFAFAATGSCLISESLILISDTLLGLPWEAVASHGLAALVVAIGLSSLNVGLGAYMPNFKETDPSKIVVGFGGTVNMVIGLMFLVIVTIVMLGPIHAAGLQNFFNGKKDEDLPLWAFAGLPVGLIIGAIVVRYPLRAGARSLCATEF